MLIWWFLIKDKIEKANSTDVLNWDCMIHISDSFQKEGGVDWDLGKWNNGLQKQISDNVQENH